MQLINMILWYQLSNALLTLETNVYPSESRLGGAFQSKRKIYSVSMVLYDDDNLNFKFTLKFLSARKHDHVKIRVLMLLKNLFDTFYTFQQIVQCCRCVKIYVKNCGTNRNSKATFKGAKVNL